MAGADHVTIFHHLCGYDRFDTLRSVSTIVSLAEFSLDTLALF
jgi:hypothetical protein